MTEKELKAKAKQILKEAESVGVTDNFLFVTTFERYLFELEMLDNLQKQIKESETLVEKEYIKNRKNVVINPLIRSYNSCSNEANKTLNSLLKIIESCGKNVAKKEEEKDILLDIINGNSCDDED